MELAVSVVLPAFNAADSIGACLRALQEQRLAREGYEIIVVDDGSTDGTAAIAEPFADRVIRQANCGAAAARNAGIFAARAPWVALIDADCVPSRGWLATLLRAVRHGSDERRLGATGTTLGLQSATPAARYVDLVGGLDPARYLSHPRFPFAPSGNLMYRRDALIAVGGFDERFRTYEACDLHDRLRRHDPSPFEIAPRAVVFHRHRTSWRAYWRQQYGYGIGYAQFMRSRADEVPWSLGSELAAWARLAGLAAAAFLPGGDDRVLVRRGTFVKHAAQRAGFLVTYWNARERQRWADARR